MRSVDKTIITAHAETENFITTCSFQTLDSMRAIIVTYRVWRGSELGPIDNAPYPNGTRRFTYCNGVSTDTVARWWYCFFGGGSSSKSTSLTYPVQIMHWASYGALRLRASTPLSLNSWIFIVPCDRKLHQRSNSALTPTRDSWTRAVRVRFWDNFIIILASH